MCGADATTTIKRSDFGIKYAIPAVGDDVKLSIPDRGVQGLMLAAHFTRFFEANPGWLHFARAQPPSVARRHARRPTQQYWIDAATRVDRKWEQGLRRGRAGRAATTSRGCSASPIRSQVAFAPNTHEFVCRALLLPRLVPARCACSRARTSSTASGARRAGSLETGPRRADRDSRRALRDVHRNASPRRRAPAAWDLVWLSHVFFDSGFVVPELERDRRAPRPPTRWSSIDGYHAFCALPVDLARDPPAGLLPRRRLQVRDVGRGRLLPRGAAGQHAASRRYRLVRRRSRRSSAPAGTRGAVLRRRVALLGLDLRSLGALSLQRRDGLAAVARAPAIGRHPRACAAHCRSTSSRASRRSLAATARCVARPPGQSRAAISSPSTSTMRRGAAPSASSTRASTSTGRRPAPALRLRRLPRRGEVDELARAHGPAPAIIGHVPATSARPASSASRGSSRSRAPFRSCVATVVPVSRRAHTCACRPSPRWSPTPR